MEATSWIHSLRPVLVLSLSIADGTEASPGLQPAPITVDQVATVRFDEDVLEGGSYFFEGKGARFNPLPEACNGTSAEWKWDSC